MQKCVYIHSCKYLIYFYTLLIVLILIKTVQLKNIIIEFYRLIIGAFGKAKKNNQTSYLIINIKRTQGSGYNKN